MSVVLANKVARVVARLRDERKKLEKTLTDRQRIDCDDAKHLRDVYRAIEEILPSLEEVQLELKEEQPELVPA